MIAQQDQVTNEVKSFVGQTGPAEEKKKKWQEEYVDEALIKLIPLTFDELPENLKALAGSTGWDVLKLDRRLKGLRNLFKDRDTGKQQEKAKPELTDEQLAQAIELGQKDLLVEFKKAHKTLGFEGNNYTTRSLMHTSTARLCKRRQGWLYHGGSRTGKDKGLKAQGQLIHPSNFLKATTMTEGAVYGLGYLDHLFILSGELDVLRPGEDDAMQRLLRQFISEEELVRLRLEKQVSGAGEKYVNTESKVSGYASIVWTTTKDPRNLKDEFALRLTSVKSDESEEITESVLESKAQRAKDPAKSAQEEEAVKEQFRNFDLSLKPYAVKIPFADLIRPRNNHTTARSIFQLLLDHVEISALLNQHKTDRIKTDDGCLEATLEDYDAAYELVLHGAFEVLSTASRSAKQAYTTAYEHWKTKINLPFKQVEMRAFLGVPKSTFSDWLNQWLDSGMAEEDHPNRNLYRLLPWCDTDKGLGLITPEELRRLVEGNDVE